MSTTTTTTLMRHSQFGICAPAGNTTIDGVQFLTLRFANGFVHIPISAEPLADLSEVPPMMDENSEPLTDRTGVLRYPPLSRLGLDAEVGGDTDLSLPPRKDAHEDAEVELTMLEIAA